MSLTPNSGASPYLDPATFLMIRDLSLVQSLWLDGEDRTDGLPSRATLIADPLVAFCLAEASGKLESAAIRGNRYGTADLAALNGNSKAHMQGIVASLALEYLRRKRGASWAPLPEYADALEDLKAIADGSEIFAFAETEAAGTTQSASLTQAEWDRLNLATTRAGRIFSRHRGSGIGNGGR